MTPRSINECKTYAEKVPRKYTIFEVHHPSLYSLSLCGYVTQIETS